MPHAVQLPELAGAPQWAQYGPVTGLPQAAQVFAAMEGKLVAGRLGVVLDVSASGRLGGLPSRLDACNHSAE